ncbi:sulfotransferase 1A2-like [Littorina saxatilis]|uniref:Sulfotransferase domain-containing protein n=1 Tax=Littorina saxatilis TaxID=31220 RepID=A0AAN9AJU1_9CAEN
MAQDGASGGTPGGPINMGSLPTVEVEGWVFPKLFEKSRPMKEHIALIRVMQMRDDDVILCAYPKSGTHWLWEVGSMLLTGKAEYEKRTKEHVMMEACDVEDMDSLPSPRLLNTHLPTSMLPNQVKDGKVKVIHVYRNPKDVLVSMYHQIIQIPPCKDMTLEMILGMFMSEKCIGGNYFKYLREVDTFIKENPQVPVFNMSFEQMKRNQVGMVQNLARFLGVDASPKLCISVAEACSFKNLKEANKSKDGPQFMKDHKLEMYRKGQVGDWKNHLTVAQSEMIDAAMEQLKRCDYNISFTL